MNPSLNPSLFPHQVLCLYLGSLVVCICFFLTSFAFLTWIKNVLFCLVLFLKHTSEACMVENVKVGILRIQSFWKRGDYQMLWRIFFLFSLITKDWKFCRIFLISLGSGTTGYPCVMLIVNTVSNKGMVSVLSAWPTDWVRGFYGGICGWRAHS